MTVSLLLQGAETVSVKGATGASGIQSGYSEDVPITMLSSAMGAGGFGTQPNVFNFNPSVTLAKWRLALAKVKNGAANARILCVGDSTTAGIGDSTQATIPATNSFPARLASMLNSTILPAAEGLGVPPSILSGNPDGRWVNGTGWAKFNFGAGNGASWEGTGTTGNLVFTQSPQVNCDSFYVYYLTNSGGGTLTLTATGGTPVVQTTSAAQGTSRVLVTASAAATTNTLTATSSGGNVFIVGVEPLLSTKSQVLVGNAGVGSSTTSGWVSSPTTFGGIPLIKAVVPDLTIISLGINDATAGLSPTAYAANIQTLITAAQVSGDVLICDMLPTLNAAPYAVELTYLSPLISLAANNNCAYLSIFNRFGGAYNSNFMFTDGVHGNDLGYWDWAQALANLLDTP